MDGVSPASESCPEKDNSSLEGRFMKKLFHIRDVLAIVTGLSCGREHFAALQEVYGFVEGQGDLSEGFTPRAKKENLLRQFPQLAGCGEDFPPEELAVLKAGTDEGAIADILSRWLSRQIDKHGEFLEVSSS